MATERDADGAARARDGGERADARERDERESIEARMASQTLASTSKEGVEMMGMMIRAVVIVAAIATVVAVGTNANVAEEAFAGSAGAPASASCANGEMISGRIEKAREVLTCNQENWREHCLENYDDGEFYYVDGPGLTEARGKAEMERYLRNQFDFSRQFLTVEEETCAGDSYVATWRLDMRLSTGVLRNLHGISTLKFRPDSTKIVYHRDYLADGAITEKNPIVGPLVKVQRQAYATCMKSAIGCAKILGGVED